ncbi:MAG: hypothetical protein WB587_11525 [Nitrososphaeraceae archaeon]
MASEEERKNIKNITDVSREEVLRILKNERSHEVILQELKDAYQRQWDLKDSHEKKATSIITISGILTSLLFGFAGFIHNSESIITHFDLVITFVIISIASNSLAVLFSIVSLRMKDYRFLYTDLTDDDIIKETNKPKLEVLGNLMGEYNKSTNHNAEQNQSKLKWIKTSSWFLFAGIVTILFVLIIAQLK